MNNIKVWGHRGAAGYAPENTIEAFCKAVDMGADGVELDVQLTCDGQLVVIHDEVINRVSDGSGFVRDYTLEELKKFNFNKTHPEYGNLKIPTLEEVYQLLKNTDLEVNVELKTGVFFYEGIEEQVLELAERMDMECRIWYSSFNHYSILKLKQLNPKARAGLLYSDGFIDIPEYAKRIEASAIHPHICNLQYPGLIEGCRKKNLAIHVWTVNDPYEIDLCYECNVDAIITNYPDVVKAYIETRQAERNLES